MAADTRPAYSVDSTATSVGVAMPKRRNTMISTGSSRAGDRKSTRLNSSHLVISYAVFCLKKKKKCAQLLVAWPVHRWGEDWLRHAARMLDYPQLVHLVHQVLATRRSNSLTGGRLSTPAQV